MAAPVMDLLYWLLVYLTDYAKLYLVVFWGFSLGRRTLRRAWLLPVAGAVLVLLTVLLPGPGWLTDGSVVALSLLGVCFQLTGKKAIPLVFAGVVGLSTIEVLLVGLVFRLAGGDFHNMRGTYEQLLNLGVYAVTLAGVYAVCALLVRRRKRQGKASAGWYGGTAAVWVGGLLGTIGLLSYAGFLFPMLGIAVDGGLYGKSGQLLAGLTISGLALMAAFLITTLSSARSHRLKREKQEMEALHQRQLAYYNNVLEKKRQADALRHDMRGHLHSIAALLEQGESSAALAYIAEIGGTLDGLRQAETGHPVLNALADDIFRGGGVRLEWKGAFPVDTCLTDFQVCVLFSNLLQNAVNAAQGSARPAVEVHIKSEGTHIHIRVKNTVAGPVPLVDGRPRRDGGLGVDNLLEVVRRLDGTVAFQNGPGCFTAAILLPGVLEPALDG